MLKVFLANFADRRAGTKLQKILFTLCRVFKHAQTPHRQLSLSLGTDKKQNYLLLVHTIAREKVNTSYNEGNPKSIT